MTDYLFGFNNEVALKETIETVTGKLSHLGKWDTFDYCNQQCFVELKSRTCNKDRYPTTMVGMNKVNEASSLFDLYDFYFFFKFTDGLYYWKYVPDHGYQNEPGGRFDRGKAEIRDYLYIPVNDLVKVKKVNNSADGKVN